ncbi:MAG: response regulator, partial [Bacteroidetes bacterium]|nr:response regulator [Bacteroidota bacterium]
LNPPSGRIGKSNPGSWALTPAGKNGYSIFHPESIRTEKNPPKVLITNLRLFNQRIQPGNDSPLSQPMIKTKNIKLKHHQDNIAFEYVALHYDRTEDIQYAYKMKGIDEDWVMVESERIARYPKLAPGNYSFQVKAANADGEWNEGGASIDIQVLKPWWGTWLAYTIYAMVLAGILFFFYRFQLNRKLEKEDAKRVKELDAVKTKLYTNITHEFRTPLTIILGMVDQIKENPQAWFSEGLQMIKRSGKNLLHLVNQMLDLSKLESEAMPLNMMQGDIIAYLKYLFESFHSMAESKEIDLHFNSEPESVLMDYDPEKMRNVIFNLMSNAIKYSSIGGTISFEVNKKQELDRQLEIKIKDSGTGISKEQLPYIFDRFYQANERVNKKGGTGIGLAIVKELVKLMNGSISVASEMGKGTEFSLLLPITNNASLSEETFSKDIKEQLPPVLSLVGVEEGGKIVRAEEKPLLLIVEDNVDVVTYLSSFLRRDYQLLVANNGDEGIEKAIENIPDIILSDVMMPLKDGFELCQTLKTDERSSHIPIILLTAKADMASKFEGLELGADAYLSKPISREELELRLRKLLESRKKLQEYYSKMRPAIPLDKRYKREDVFMKKLHGILDANLDDENFGIKALSQTLYISRMQLHRKLKALTGKSTSHYLRSFRLQKAKDFLLTSNKSITEIAYDVGFKTPNYFSTSFLKEFGQSPREFRQ